jgi:hypothetical protein
MRTELRQETVAHERGSLAIRSLRCIALRGSDPRASLTAGLCVLDAVRGWSKLDEDWVESLQGMVGALRSGQVPWLLDASDPVRERVEGDAAGT